MDSKHVNRLPRAVTRPILKDHGFVFHTERTAWRHRGALIPEESA